MSAPVAAPPAAPAAGAPAAAPGGAPTGQTPAAVKAEALRFKKALKVNGREVPVDLDELGLETELAAGFHARHHVTSLQKKLNAQAEWEQQFQQSPEEALMARGFDLKAYVARNAQQQAQLAELTPEQQEVVRLKQELKARDDKAAKDVELTKQQRAQQRRQQAAQHAQNEQLGMLKHLGYPVEGEANRLHRGQALVVASKLQRMAIKAGKPLMTAEQLGAAIPKFILDETARTAAVVAQVPGFREKHSKELGGFVEAVTGGLEGDALLGLLGPKLLDRIVKAQLAMLQRRGGKSPVAPAANGTNDHANEQPLSLYAAQRAIRGG